MIIFHGMDFEAAAAVTIKDIYVSPIQRKVVVRERPIQAGADFVRVTDGTRTVKITFSLLEQDPYKRQEQIEAVTAWADTKQPAPMSLPYHRGKLLDVLCDNLPAPSAREWWESSLTLTFTAFDPYFYDEFDRSIACGTAFFVGGNAPPKMRIERTLSADANNQAYSDGADTMTFSTIPTGAMVIDLNRQTAQVGATSIMQYFSLLSTFILPKTGSMTITGTGTVKWRERWTA